MRRQEQGQGQLSKTAMVVDGSTKKKVRVKLTVTGNRSIDA